MKDFGVMPEANQTERPKAIKERAIENVEQSGALVEGKQKGRYKWHEKGSGKLRKLRCKSQERTICVIREESEGQSL